MHSATGCLICIIYIRWQRFTHNQRCGRDRQECVLLPLSRGHFFLMPFALKIFWFSTKKTMYVSSTYLLLYVNFCQIETGYFIPFLTIFMILIHEIGSYMETHQNYCQKIIYECISHIKNLNLLWFVKKLGLIANQKVLSWELHPHIKGNFYFSFR